MRLAEERGLRDGLLIESRGTGDWHVGEPPDARAADTAARNGVELFGCSQQLTPADLKKFDLFVCMDRDNVAGVRKLGAPADRIVLLRDFEPDADSPDVPDPYFGEGDGFQRVYRIIERGCAGLLDHLSNSS